MTPLPHIALQYEEKDPQGRAWAYLCTISAWPSCQSGKSISRERFDCYNLVVDLVVRYRLLLVIETNNTPGVDEMKHTPHLAYTIVFIILLVVFFPAAIIFVLFWINTSINNRGHNKREAARIKKNDGLNQEMLNELKLLRKAQGVK